MRIHHFFNGNADRWDWWFEAADFSKVCGICFHRSTLQRRCYICGMQWCGRCSKEHWEDGRDSDCRGDD